jgi:hypothetical protein
VRDVHVQPGEPRDGQRPIIANGSRAIGSHRHRADGESRADDRRPTARCIARWASAWGPQGMDILHVATGRTRGPGLEAPERP